MVLHCCNPEKARIPSWLATSALVAVLAACGGSSGAARPSCAADRDAVLASAADVAAFAVCTTARSVVIRSGAALDLSGLRALTAVSGDLVIGPTVAIEQIELGGLREVGGSVRVVANGMLQQLRLPGLERAGAIDIAGNPALAAIALPRLRTLRGALHVTDDAALELLDVSALTAVDGELAVSDVPALTVLETDQLQRAASVQIDAPKLASDVIDRLRATSAR